MSNLLNLITTSWDVNEVETTLQNELANLSNAESEQIQKLWQERKALIDKLSDVETLIDSQPEVASSQLEEIASQGIDKHPRYKNIKARIDNALKESLRQKVMAICDRVENRLKRKDYSVIEENPLDKLPLGWISDPESRQRVETVKDLIAQAEDIAQKRRQLADAIAEEKLNEAEALLVALQGEDGLESYREAVEKLALRMSGQSTTKKTTGDQIADQRAALVSLVGAENWRAAYNGLYRLVQLLIKEGKTDEAQQEQKKADEYLNNLREHTYQTIDDRLELAEAALKKGNLIQVKELLDRAETTGHVPPAKAGQIEDVADNIDPTREQKKRISEIRGELLERENRRQDAEALVQTALQQAEQRSIEALHQALQTLKLASDKDPHYPGLQRFEVDITAQISVLQQTKFDILGKQIDRACQTGNLKSAEDGLEQLQQLGASREIIATAEVSLQQANERLQKIEQQKSHFYNHLEQAKNELDCSQTKVLQESVNQWQELAFSSIEVTVAQGQLDSFTKNCQTLTEYQQVIETTLSNSSSNLDDQIYSAERLADSSVGQFPKIARLLVRFWRAVADYHANYNRDTVEYLRKAQRIAEEAGEQTLVNQLTTEIGQALSKSAEGKKIAEIEKRLRDYRDKRLISEGLTYIETLSSEKTILSDPDINSLISDITLKASRKQAETALVEARNAFNDNDLETAQEAIEYSLEQSVIIEAQILQQQIQRKIDQEKRYNDILETALNLNLLNIDEPLNNANQQKLLEAKTLAETLSDGVDTTDRLKTKATLVTQQYQQWQDNINLRLTLLESEVDDFITNLEFNDALTAIQTIEQTGLPPQLLPKLMAIRQRVRKTERDVKQIQRRIEITKSLADKGEYIQALHDLNTLGQLDEIPQRLQNEIEQLETSWTEKHIDHQIEYINNIAKNGALLDAIDLYAELLDDDNKAKSFKLIVPERFKDKIARQQTKTIENHVRIEIDKAKQLTSQGKFLQGSRSLDDLRNKNNTNSADFTIPKTLFGECLELEEKWSNYSKTYSSLSEDLPKKRSDLEQLLQDYDNSDLTEKLASLVSEVSEKFAETIRIELAETQEVRQGYESLRKVSEWLGQVLYKINDKSGEINVGIWSSLIEKGEALKNKLPPIISSINFAIGNRINWLQERENSSKKLNQVNKQLAKVGIIFKPFGSLSSAQSSLRNIEPQTISEKTIKEELESKIESLTYNQYWRTGLIVIFPVFSTLICVLLVWNTIIQPLPTPTATHTPIVITATLAPTNTPTETPTPTITATPTETLTPTPTPEIVQNCQIDAERWLLREPGGRQADREDRTNTFLNQFEDIGILRDVPDDPQLQDEWVKIVTEGEARGWVPRSWLINCN